MSDARDCVPRCEIWLVSPPGAVAMLLEAFTNDDPFVQMRANIVQDATLRVARGHKALCLVCGKGIDNPFRDALLGLSVPLTIPTEAYCAPVFFVCRGCAADEATLLSRVKKNYELGVGLEVKIVSDVAGRA